MLPARIFAFALLTFALALTCPAEPPFLKLPFGLKKIQADPDADYSLAKEDGPWMILAHTFVGTNSRDKAHRLVVELRSSLNLPAMIYKEKFDFTGGPKTNADETRKLRFHNQYEYEAYAVLVGEYDTTDHPNAQNDLERIKHARPAIFADKQAMQEETDRSTPMTLIKAVHKKWVSANTSNEMGPMRNAFMTRNPLLPPEYFKAPTVDSFVAELNEGVPNCLLDCPGKYTVTVRTFEGYGLIANGNYEKNFKPNRDRLAKCAADAMRMVTELRKNGVEAYQFHDRTKSIVTVGSFDTLGRELPEGDFEYAPEILRTMDQYRAFNVRPELARQVPMGQRGDAANNIANIPYDIQPVPIAVPKKSKRSLFIGLRN